MAAKRTALWFYLTLACFLGIILIFIFDGYMGVYDTLTIQTGEYPEQKIDADEWTRRYADFSTSVEWNSKAFFTYEVDNRWFSTYVADVEVSLWHEQEKVTVLVARPISVASFDKEELEWILDTAEVVPVGVSPEQGYNFTMIIKRGEIERRFTTHIRPEPYPPKPIVIEPPR